MVRPKEYRRRVTCVEGKLGTGKSAPLAEMARQAEAAGSAVRFAYASAVESGWAFDVVDQLFPGQLDDFELTGHTDMHTVLRHLARHR